MGFINKYRKGVPFPKKLLEDFIYRIRYVFLFFRNGFQVKTVLFYPDYPSKRSVLYKLLRILKYNRTNNPGKKFDLAIHWDIQTFRKDQPLLNRIDGDRHVINIGCTDISKKHIDEIHQQVFHYGTLVDPTIYRGKCVMKSNLNALHDGRIIDCPVTAVDNSCIYQLVINNQVDADTVEDIRIPVIGEEMPLGYLNYKPVTARFGSYMRFNSKVRKKEVVRPGDIFSPEEIAQIREFLKRLKMDYGELDILRNRDDGKIYIVDANNTPTGPSHLDSLSRKEALQQLAASFHRQFLAMY